MEKVLARGYDDVNVVHGVFGSACYIQDSFPSVLYMAYRWGGGRGGRGCRALVSCVAAQPPRL
jgi:hypothetical protein